MKLQRKSLIPILCLGVALQWKIVEADTPRTQVIWEKTSLHLVAPDGNYARMIRLQSGKILCGYSDGRGQWVKRSSDNGLTWDGGTLVVSRPPNSELANAEMLQLKNGQLLFFSNRRPFKNQPQTPPDEFSIGVSRSVDDGISWSPIQYVYNAGTEGANGCWEPAGLQLPSGEIQLFFADESPYKQSDEQQISLMRSYDNGLHWSDPENASFRQGHRDGMPAPLQLTDGTIVFAIEDNGLDGPPKPAIIGTSPQENWKWGTVSGNSPNRWGALQTPLETRLFAGAPYLRLLPTGETVLSFQQGDEPDLRHFKMSVCIGDKTAHNFASPTQPFAAFTTSAQLWNSLLVKDKTTLTAITSTQIGGVFGIWTIEGKLVPNQ